MPALKTPSVPCVHLLMVRAELVYVPEGGRQLVWGHGWGRLGLGGGSPLVGGGDFCDRGAPLHSLVGGDGGALCQGSVLLHTRGREEQVSL